jgi:hypothetical protein
MNPKLMSLLAAGMLMVSTLAVAQIRDAGSKIRGDAMQGHEAVTYQRHAQDRSQILYHYSHTQQPIPKQEAKELVGGIKSDLAAADKALAKLKTEHAKEPEVVKLIETIEKQHAKAHQVCGMAEEQCLKEHGDHVVIANCCTEMWQELDAAQANTQKLLKLLKIEKLETPKKVEAKKDAAK